MAEFVEPLFVFGYPQRIALCMSPLLYRCYRRKPVNPFVRLPAPVSNQALGMAGVTLELLPVMNRPENAGPGPAYTVGKNSLRASSTTGNRVSIRWMTSVTMVCTVNKSPFLAASSCSFMKAGTTSVTPIICTGDFRA